MLDVHPAHHAASTWREFQMSYPKGAFDFAAGSARYPENTPRRRGFVVHPRNIRNSSNRNILFDDSRRRVPAKSGFRQLQFSVVENRPSHSSRFGSRVLRGISNEKRALL
jgi:hypothetical protein